MKEYYAGIDINKDKYVGCIADQKGKVLRELTFPPIKEGAQSFFARMSVKSVAIEHMECGD
jgi:hypothetical protein